jgi:hypothetical protein
MRAASERRVPQTAFADVAMNSGTYLAPIPYPPDCTGGRRRQDGTGALRTWAGGAGQGVVGLDGVGLPRRVPGQP